jgi:hypothetical protein
MIRRIRAGWRRLGQDEYSHTPFPDKSAVSTTVFEPGFTACQYVVPSSTFFALANLGGEIDNVKPVPTPFFCRYGLDMRAVLMRCELSCWPKRSQPYCDAFVSRDH